MSQREEFYRPSVVTCLPLTNPLQGAVSVSRARGQNFLVEWLDFGAGASHSLRGSHETLLLLDSTGARIVAGTDEVAAPAHSVCVLPPGEVRLDFESAGAAVLLRTDGFETGALNDTDYAVPNPRVAPVGQPYLRTGGPSIQVIPVNEIRAPEAKPRLKIVQSDTMSISWIEYTVVRDRSKLTPHNHDDFEQGSLAITGDFLHHIRAPWGANANMWLEDAHLKAPARSLTMIPPPLIHTTEGQGGPGDRHVLIDVFAPVRRDFFTDGWITNGKYYALPEGENTASVSEAAL